MTAAYRCIEVVGRVEPVIFVSQRFVKLSLAQMTTKDGMVQQVQYAHA